MTTPGAAIRPKADSQVPDNVLRGLLSVHAVHLSPATPVAVIGVRGFFKSLAGAETGKNLIGVYDDAICIVTPSASRTFAGNTDPSRTIAERAQLQLGLYEFGPVVHNRTKPPEERRLAFGQMSGVTVRRFQADGQLGEEERGVYIGCNLHDGSITTTGSAACQTVVPERWLDFAQGILTPLGIPFTEWATVTTRIKNGEPLPEHWAKARFPYLLVQ